MVGYNPKKGYTAHPEIIIAARKSSCTIENRLGTHTVQVDRTMRAAPYNSATPEEQNEFIKKGG